MASSAVSPGRTVRSAFLIGQCKYEQFTELENPGNDVEKLHEILSTKCGFKVEKLMNAKKADFEDLPNRFAQSLEGCPNSVFLLYYAGHGLWCKGQPHLVPVDASKNDPDSCENLYGLLQMVHDVAEGACRGVRAKAATASSSSEAAGSSLLVVLDCCRKCPKSSANTNWRESWITNSNGYLPVSTKVSFLFACDEGRAAMENSRTRHGFFTTAFIHALEQPGLTWSEVWDRTRHECVEDSNSRQRPWMSDSSGQTNSLVLHTREERRCQLEMATETDSGQGEDPFMNVTTSRGADVVVRSKDRLCAFFADSLPLVLMMSAAGLIIVYVWGAFTDGEELAVVCFLPLPHNDQYINSACLLPGLVEYMLLWGTPWLLFCWNCMVANIFFASMFDSIIFTFLIHPTLAALAYLVGVMVTLLLHVLIGMFTLLFLGWWFPMALWPDLLLGQPADASIIMTLAGAMAMRWTYLPALQSGSQARRRVQPFQSVEVLKSSTRLQWEEMVVSVCTKLLPFWLMQGTACFLLLEIGRNVPWLPKLWWCCKVPLLVFLAVPIAFCCRHWWLSKVGCDEIRGWHLLDVLLSSILASHHTYSFFLSFDPSMKWHPGKSTSTYRSMNYEAFIMVVAMSVMALWRRSGKQPVSEQSVEMVLLSLDERPAV